MWDGEQRNKNDQSVTRAVQEDSRWSLGILEDLTRAKGLRFYQAAAAWTMVWQVAGALPVTKVIGFSASCSRKSVTKSRHEGRLAPRRYLGKGA
jgi:hypothetical protein